MASGGWTPSAAQSRELNGHNYNIPEMVKTPVFWVMVVMFIFANAAGTMMVSATSPIAQNQIGQSAMMAAMCVSIMTLANMCGRIGFGFIYDKLKGWNSLLLVLVINGISMCMLTAAHSLGYFILCICLVGFSFGGLLVVFAPMVKIIFGSRFYNRNYGLIFIGYGIGAFVGPRSAPAFMMPPNLMWPVILDQRFWRQRLLVWYFWQGKWLQICRRHKAVCAVVLRRV